MAKIKIITDECCCNCPEYEEDSGTVIHRENGRVDTLVGCAKYNKCDLIYVSTMKKKLEGKK